MFGVNFKFNTKKNYYHPMSNKHIKRQAFANEEPSIKIFKNIIQLVRLYVIT